MYMSCIKGSLFWLLHASQLLPSSLLNQPLILSFFRRRMFWYNVKQNCACSLLPTYSHDAIPGFARSYINKAGASAPTKTTQNSKVQNSLTSLNTPSTPCTAGNVILKTNCPLTSLHFPSAFGWLVLRFYVAFLSRLMAYLVFKLNPLNHIDCLEPMTFSPI